VSFVLSTLLMMMLYTACGVVAGAVQKGVGLLSVGHAVVLGCGAYAYAATAKSGIGPLFGIAAALLIGSLAGTGLTVLAARVNDERYALTSFGIQIVWIGLVTNLEAITGGVLGIPGIPTPGDTMALLAGTVPLVALAAIVHTYLERVAEMVKG
jgi:ABC-type branched-subunit amino acid transport system permease subunit